MYSFYKKLEISVATSSNSNFYKFEIKLIHLFFKSGWLKDYIKIVLMLFAHFPVTLFQPFLPPC